MIRVLVFTLLLACACSFNNDNAEVIDIEQESTVKKGLQINKLFEYETENEAFHFLSLESTKEGEIYAFNKVDGQIIKFNRDGKIVKRVGKIGEGPNEFIVDINVNLLYCGNSRVIANDWSLPRLHVYNSNLELIRIIQLDGIPYETACYDENTVLVLFSNKQEGELVRTNGEILKSIKIDDKKANDLSKFKHIKYVNGNYFVGYYFTPLLLRYNDGQGKTHKILLPTKEGKEVKTAIRNITTLNNSIHVFFNNINTGPEDRQTHVFSVSGSYQFSYSIPTKINYYEFISNNKLIAIEDSLKQISMYKFKIHE